MATKAKAGPGGSQKKGRSTRGRTTARSVQNDRYTPPIAKNVRTSPRWMGPTIIAFFLIGVVVVILNYAGLLPGGVNNLWLVAAIGSIFVGLLLATRFH